MSINILLVEGTKHGEINHCEVVKIFNAHLISMLLCFATTSTVIIACCPCKQETPASRAARRKNWSVLGTLPTSGTRPMKQLRSTNFSIRLRLHTHTHKSQKLLTSGKNSVWPEPSHSAPLACCSFRCCTSKT